jgi:protein-disulfide isomerase
MLKSICIIWAILVSLSQAATPQAAVHGYCFGNPNAPIKIRMYYSLTCAHCKEWETKYFPEIQAKYIQSQRVYFEMVDFPTDQLSVKVAQLAWCAGIQQYPILIKDLFEQQEKWMAAKDPLQAAKEIVMRHGLTAHQCDVCMLSKSAEAQIMSNVAHAINEHKVPGAPSFLVNGKLIEDMVTPDMLNKMSPKKHGVSPKNNR